MRKLTYEGDGYGVMFLTDEVGCDKCDATPCLEIDTSLSEYRPIWLCLKCITEIAKEKA